MERVQGEEEPKDCWSFSTADGEVPQFTSYPLLQSEGMATIADNRERGELDGVAFSGDWMVTPLNPTFLPLP